MSGLTHLAHAPMQDLALGHELFHQASDVLDRRLGVDAVLVEQVDPVSLQTLEHEADHDHAVVAD